MRTKLSLVVAAILVTSHIGFDAAAEVKTFINPVVTTPNAYPSSEKDLRLLASQLDRLEKEANKWGKVSVSEIILVPNDKQFSLNYTQSTAYYINSARTNIDVQARGSIETYFKTMLEIQASAEGPVSLGDLPTASESTNSLTLPDPLSQTNLAASSFISPPTPLLQLPSGNLELRERLALTTGVNDKMAEVVYSLMTDPQAPGDDKEVYFGVIQVGCQPGTQTKNGYIADVNISLEYATEDACAPNGLAMSRDTSRRLPSVFAVFPMMDSQKADLANSRRRQDEILLSMAGVLSASGFKGTAKSMTDFVKKKEHDIRTRTIMPTYTTYSDGASFGIQMYPEVRAMGDPAKNYSNSERVLEANSFPVVVVIVMDKADAGKELVVNVQDRWIPLGSKPRQSILTKHDLAKTINAGWATVKSYDKQDSMYFQLRRQLMTLENLTLGITRVSKIPKKEESTYAGVMPITLLSPPTMGVKGSPVVFRINGGNFFHEDAPYIYSVNVNGVECAFDVLSKNLIVAKYTPISLAAAGTMFNVNVMDRKGNLSSIQTPLEVLAPAASLKHSTVALARNSDGKITNIVFQAGADLKEGDLLKGLIPILEKSEAAPRVKETILQPK